MHNRSYPDMQLQGPEACAWLDIRDRSLCAPKQAASHKHACTAPPQVLCLLSQRLLGPVKDLLDRPQFVYNIIAFFYSCKTQHQTRQSYVYSVTKHRVGTPLHAICVLLRRTLQPYA